MSFSPHRGASNEQVAVLMELIRRRYVGVFQIDNTCTLLQRVIVEEPVPDEYSIDWLIPILDSIFITIAQSISEDELASEQISHIKTIFELAERLCKRLNTTEAEVKAKEWIAVQRVVVQQLSKNTSIAAWLKERNPYIQLIERLSDDKIPLSILLEEYITSKDVLLQMLSELKNVGLIKQC